MAARGVRALLMAGIALELCLGAAPAVPCGTFARFETKHIPSISVEQTLILFDEAARIEHFVREATFKDATASFGFVVPTPELPTVSAVSHSPFEDLAREYPVHRDAPPPPQLAAMAAAASEPSVRVVSRERVGSFTAFVLAAADPRALSHWLQQNSFTTTPASEAWLRHYVALGFYYAALRYEPPATIPPTGAARTETIRISFSTPLPYYPYREPTPSPESRELAVWLVSNRRYVPVSAFAAAQISWKRPLQEWRLWTQFATGILGDDLSPLLPAKERDAATLQAFEDQKSTREGWGDIVFVPETPVAVEDSRWPNYRKLMAALDPSLASQP